MIMMQLNGGQDRFPVSPLTRPAPRVYGRPKDPIADEAPVTPLEVVAGAVAIAATIGFAAVCFAIA
jgi:hypothetical protein